MIYEFITPSDAITFKACDDAIAFAVGLIVGRGSAGVLNTETQESLNTLMFFCTEEDLVKIVSDNLNTDLETFIINNKQEIISSLNSFMYGSENERVVYDAAISAITDKTKLKEFKSAHEDRQRSSVAKWVQDAWTKGEQLSNSSTIE